MRDAALAAALLACDRGDDPCVAGEDVWTATAAPVCVRGDLVVMDRSDEALERLTTLEEIGGSLLVQSNADLRRLPAMPALTRIAGSLAVSNNPALTAVAGFPALEELGGGIYIGENPELVSFALGDLLTSTGPVFVALNPKLGELRAAFTRSDGDLMIAHNAALTTLAMPALAEIAGSFHLDANPALRALDLSGLRTVRGNWRIHDNDALESLTGFSALAEVVELEVSDNDALTEFEVAGPTAVKVLFVRENSALERITGTDAVRLTPGLTSLRIYANPSLQVVDGFDRVDGLGILSITRNDRLREVSGFGGLTRIDGSLSFTGNPMLTGPAEWFPALTRVADLAIHENASLPSSVVEALLARITVEGSARVGDNKGQDTALEPCPWPDDGICDARPANTADGTGLCARDPEDCGE